MQSLTDLISRMVQSATSLYQLKALEPEPHLVECLTKALYDMETVNDYWGIGEAGLNVNVIDDEGEYTIGCINLYKNEHTFEWNYDPTYIIFVDYIDSVNSADYDQELLDDM